MGDKLLGSTEPRLFTPPLRPLTRSTTHGFAVIDFARDVVGEPLLPWEEFAVIHGLELLPDGTYRFRINVLLAARQNGKTHTKKIIRLWKMFVGGSKLTLGTAQDVTTAQEIWTACLDTIRSTPSLLAELDKVQLKNGDIWFRLSSGARYKISAANRSAGRGLSVDDLDFEELREQLDWAAWSALSKTTQARRMGQIWAMSNQGDNRSVVLNRLRVAAGIKVGENGVACMGQAADPSIGWLEWSAAEGCDLDDRSAWQQANPGLGYVIDERAIASACATDPPGVFRTEVLCQQVDALETAIDAEGWKEGRDTGSLDSLRRRIVLCFDMAPDGRHATLIAGAKTPDGRARVEAVAHWKDSATARAELLDWITRIKPIALGWFPSGPAAAFSDVFEAASRWDPDMPLVAFTGTKVNQACMGLADLSEARRVLHPGDPLIDTHIGNANRLNVGDGWRFVRREVGHVDAAYAVGGAVHMALTIEPPVKAPRALVV